MNQSTASGTPGTTPIVPLSVNLKDGIAWTTNWREGDHHLKARSFTFDADEFRAILAEPTVVKIRFYLSLVISGEQSDEVIEKLICVGVDQDGKDIIYGEENPKDGEGDGTGIYDFSNPCPPLCSAGNESSPLN